MITQILRTRVQQEVRRYRPGWTNLRVNQTVLGFLSATNLDNGNGHAGDRLAHLYELNADTVANIIERIHQSAAAVTLTDLEWRFTIDPRSFFAGAGSAKPPSWVPKKHLVATWYGHEDSFGHINCAAYAISFFLLDRRATRMMNVVNEKARNLQSEMEWDESVDLEQLSRFVDHNPEYQLVVLLPTCTTESPFVYTGDEYDYSEEDRSKQIYLVYDASQQHYGLTKTPAKLFRNTSKNNNLKWCHKCLVVYDGQTIVHSCDEGNTKKPTFGKKCIPCQVVHLPGDSCQYISCRTCSSTYAKGSEYHRCIIQKPPRSEKKNRYFEGDEGGDGNYPALWVYDLESRVQIVENRVNVITGFNVKEDGKYDENDCCVYDIKVDKHVANFICFRNVFSDQEITYFGDDCIQRFLLYMLQFNMGNNICIAHNASGYDTRLVFNVATQLNLITSLSPIMRGGKFMQLTVNKKLIFRDSLLHVRGSLKGLAIDFVGRDSIRKGHFPHLFNTIENYDYVGTIPDKKYFDLSFTARSQRDIDEFDSWYEEWVGREDWSFRRELEAYCINDVLVLSHIVKGYNDIAMAQSGMTPWMNATAPSYVHEVFVRKLTTELELPDEKEDPNLYKQTIQDLAWNKHWAVLNPSEYWFARKALRGGRTEIRKVFHQVSDEDWARGVRIRYQDICSQYPYQQIFHRFPVGIPRIHVYDLKYYPCYKHRNNQSASCDCPRERRGNPFCDITWHDTQPTAQEIIGDDTFFGWVCASLTPPKDLYHPVLVNFDDELGKSVASCLPIIEGTFISMEFVQALKVGYTIDKIHRYDKINMAPSLWEETLKDFYLEKMINSRKAPEGDELAQLINDYEEKFGLGDAIRKSVAEGRWGKNPAMKQTAKIMMNSAWGKHAQRPIMTEAAILDFITDEQSITNLFQNLSTGACQFMDATQVSDNSVMYKYQANGAESNPNLHEGYLPAGMFVPAYGRLQLWNELNKLGDRVLMNDTDSIVYIYDPDLYNIPVGSLLGEWEIEDIDKDHGGIRRFVGLGPKTYGVLCEDGYATCKAKGLSLNFATSDLVNYFAMEGLVKKFLAGDVPQPIQVPQKNFTWTVNDGMKTHLAMKELKFNPDEMKGTLSATGKLYPFGFNPSLIN